MKAITLTQPWATLVAIGAKKIETRSWSTKYRGPLAIHASKVFPKEFRLMAYHQEPFRQCLIESHRIPSQRYGMTPENLPCGALVAICHLVGVIPVYKITERLLYQWTGPDDRDYRFELTNQEYAFGDYSLGRYAWLLADIHELPAPAPACGALGLWEWTGEV